MGLTGMPSQVTVDYRGPGERPYLPPSRAARDQQGQVMPRTAHVVSRIGGPVTIGVWQDGETYWGLIKEFSVLGDSETLHGLFRELAKGLEAYFASYLDAVGRYGPRKARFWCRAEGEEWEQVQHETSVLCEFVLNSKARNAVPKRRRDPPAKLSRARVDRIIRADDVAGVNLIPDLVAAGG